MRQFLTSGDAGQVVSDDGTFRSQFLAALRGERRADANDDGYLTASELGLFMTDSIANYTNNKQTPRYGKLRDRDFDQGDFVFKLVALPTGPGVVQKRPAIAPQPENAIEIRFWDANKNSQDPADFQVDQDIGRARQLLTNARNGGYEYACSEMKELPTDEMLAARERLDAQIQDMSRACFNNNPEKCMSLGYLYEKGLGVDRNLQEARNFYQIACTTGVSSGCKKVDRIN